MSDNAALATIVIVCFVMGVYITIYENFFRK